ncbi:hypothetical protein PINS_up006790 [Pythium insidiosum]|nr:hypothetical protein PINS_up006790 [Pythium insidiosum]
MADETTRPGYRGKCLYKTGKCNNERALKTSGQPHNLCDEHRMRQNEHQRKLDAKNRTARIEKRTKGSAASDGGGSSAGSTDGDDPRNAAAAAAAAAMAAVAAAASANGGGRHRYAPYNKMRLSPTGTPNGADDATGANGVMLPGGMAPPMMQFHPMNGSLPTQSPSPMMGNPEMLQNGVVILPNGPQPPHIPYPMAMQDFDGIVVPIPSYLEGHERAEFRSRIYQKVLDYIAEECMRRFGAPLVTNEAPAKASSPPLPAAESHNVPMATAPATTESSAAMHENERRASGAEPHTSEASNHNSSSETPVKPTSTNDTEQRREDWKRAETAETESEPSSPTAAERKENDKKRDASDVSASDPESAADDDAEVPPAKRVRANRSRMARKDV